MDDAEVRRQVEALDALLEHLPPTATSAVEALLGLYGETLARIVDAVRDAPDVTAALARDELVSHMLALHDVAPPQNSAVSVVPERCELCSQELPDIHPHLLDLSERQVLCACAVCALLFPQRSDASGRYRFIPESTTYLENLVFDELTWSALEIPVRVAYFVRPRDAGRVAGYYPSPVGAVESLLSLDAWQELERMNPVLRELVPDTQALLLCGDDGGTEGWIVGIDTCYRLIATMRGRWRGLRGGAIAHAQIKSFFDELRSKSRPHPNGDRHAIKGTV